MFVNETTIHISHEKKGPSAQERHASSATATTLCTSASRTSKVAANVERKKTERQLVRKLDTFLLPVLILMCIFQAVDRSALGFALINGIEADLNITQQQFNVAIAIFQVGYLLLQIPSNMLITKLSPQVYLSLCCMGWSVVAACHCFVGNYQQLLAVRVLLGVCDAPYYVGALHLLSCWYTRQELAKRTSLILGAVIVTMTFLGPIAAGIMTGLEGVHGWMGWRWMYLIFGATGLVVALLGAILLPNYPVNSRRFWLSDVEMEVARLRILDDTVDAKHVDQNKLWNGVVDACKDKRTWVFVLIMMSRKSLEGLYYYLPAVIMAVVPILAPDSAISFQNLALCLGSPPALVAAVLAFLLAYTSDRFCERTWHTVIPLFFGLIGLIISVATTDSVAKYASIYLYLAGSVVGNGMTWAWVANVIQETAEKKAVAVAMVNVFGGLGAVWSPFLFRKEDAPSYKLAYGVIIGFVVIDIACCFVMRQILRRQNLKLLNDPRRHGEVQKYVL